MQLTMLPNEFQPYTQSRDSIPSETGATCDIPVMEQ